MVDHVLLSVQKSSRALDRHFGISARGRGQWEEGRVKEDEIESDEKGGRWLAQREGQCQEEKMGTLVKSEQTQSQAQ